MQKTCVLQEILDPLFLLLHNNTFFGFRLIDLNFVITFFRKLFLLWLNLLSRALFLFAILKSGLIVTTISSHRGIKHNDFPFFLGAVGGCLNGVIPAFFAFPLVEFADGVDFPDNLSININPGVGVKLFLFQHGKVEHFILNL